MGKLEKGLRGKKMDYEADEAARALLLIEWDAMRGLKLEECLAMSHGIYCGLGGREALMLYSDDEKEDDHDADSYITTEDELEEDADSESGSGSDPESSVTSEVSHDGVVNQIKPKIKMPIKELRQTAKDVRENLLWLWKMRHKDRYNMSHLRPDSCFE